MEWHLAALTRCNVLKVGMALKCDSCQSSSWFSLEELQAKLHCPRCLTDFSFPAGIPPEKAWAYRVLGPFATSNFASGAYCVAAAMHFVEDKIAYKTSMIPSFEMKKAGDEFESDFGAFVNLKTQKPITTSLTCAGWMPKSFNRFKEEDFERASPPNCSRRGALFLHVQRDAQSHGDKRAEEDREGWPERGWMWVSILIQF